MMFSVHLLGPPEILREGRPLTIARRKSRALVYYLAAHSRPLTRDHLLALFWPDLDRPAAQQVLRTTLHGLRKALGPALLVDDDTLALDADVDTRAFGQGLHPPASDFALLSATLALYRGDFLEGFTLPDAPDFDDWVAAERERCRRLAVRGFTALAEGYETRAEYITALQALERALAFDPLQEDLQRAAIRLHYLAGDRTGAIRRYDHLRKLLDAEMGIPPMAETRTLYDAIINDRLQIPNPKPPIPILGLQPPREASNLQSPLPLSVPASLPFTGRNLELQTLQGLVASGKLGFIEGEPGIGKTRLAEEFIQVSGMLGLVGRARELEQGLPYQPVVEALRGLLASPHWPELRAALDLPAFWLAALSRLLPEFPGELREAPAEALRWSTPIPNTEESRLWEGLCQFLLALARAARRPVILVLDDLQWAAASTLALVGYLARAEASARLFILGTARPPEPRSPLALFRQSLTREDRLVTVSLARFSPAEVLGLAQRLSPQFAPPLAEWLNRVSEGNPYILAELVRYARANHLLAPSGELNLTALSTAPVLPQTVFTLIQARLARLSDPARRMLDAAVAMGRDFDVDICARAAALSENSALDALDELRAVGLVHPRSDDLTGRLYTFDHSLTMEVAYREIGELRHRLLHRRVAEALENVSGRSALDDQAGRLAFHFSEGRAPERAAPYAFRAGQQAARLAAWAEAIAFYKQALEGETEDDRRAEILMALGAAHSQAGQAAQASEAFRAALILAQSGAGELPVDDAQMALAISLLTQARFAEAIALAQEVRATGRPENAVLAEFVWGASLSVEGADLAGARAHLQNAEALCLARGDMAHLGQIKFDLGGVAAQQGDLPQAIALYREALTLSLQSSHAEAVIWAALAHNNLAYHLHLLGDPTAIEFAQAGIQLAKEKGLLTMLPYLHSTRGEIALAAHDLETAEANFREGLALAERFAMPERLAGLTANLGLVARERGQTTLAVHRLSTALARADALGLRHLGAQIRLWLAPLLPPAEARAYVTEARQIAESGGRKRLLEEVERLASQLPITND